MCRSPHKRGHERKERKKRLVCKSNPAAFAYIQNLGCISMILGDFGR